MRDLGRRVEAARLAKRWSKEQAAREAGISSITWKRVEDGLNVHDHKRAAVLAAVGLAEAPHVEAEDLVRMRETIRSSGLSAERKARLLAALTEGGPDDGATPPIGVDRENLANGA